MRPEIRKGDDLLASVDEQVRDIHIEHGVVDAVLARHDHEGAIVGSEPCQKLLADRFGPRIKLLHRESACHHRLRRAPRIEPEPLSDAEHRGCQRFLAEIHVEHGREQLDAALLES